MNREARLRAIERRLIDSARRDGPHPAAHERALAAMAGGAAVGALIGSASAATAVSSAAAVGGGTTATSGAAIGGGTAATSGVAIGGSAAATSGAAIAGGSKIFALASTLGLAKAIAIGAVSGVVALGASQKLQAPREPAPPARASIPLLSDGTRARQPTPRVPPAPLAPAPLEEPPPAPLELAAPREKSGPSHGAPPTSEPRRGTPPRDDAPPPELPTLDSPSALTTEISVLDRARSALLAGDPSRALAALDDYERTGSGRLADEAVLLRIQALLQRGETARASSLAQAFLEQHPRSPVADRLRGIVARPAP